MSAATATAVSESTVIRISREAFEAFAADHPSEAYAITRNMARVLSSRLRKSNKDVIKLTTVLGVALSRSRHQ